MEWIFWTFRKQRFGGIHIPNEESWRLIKEHFGKGSFSFKSVSENGIISAIKKLSSNKTSISNDLPVSVMKQFAKCHCEKLKNIFNDCLKENSFPNLMKIAKIKPAFKKLDSTSKDNYQARYLASLKFLRASFIHN